MFNSKCYSISSSFHLLSLSCLSSTTNCGLVVTLPSLNPARATDVVRLNALVGLGAAVGGGYCAADLLAWTVLVYR
jgi:hypothetical protein